jgi:hypothetical protein
MTDPAPRDPVGDAAPGTRRLPAARIALVIATIVSGACVLLGYRASHGGGCDGGLCMIPVVLGWVAAAVGWPIVFGLVWGLVGLANRRG